MKEGKKDDFKKKVIKDLTSLYSNYLLKQMNKIVVEPQKANESQCNSHINLNLMLGDISTRSYRNTSQIRAKEKDLTLCRIMTGCITISGSIGNISLPLYCKESEDLLD